jgi:D-glycero-D-manno-heptose 1,7-bisphosphate phosphatase
MPFLPPPLPGTELPRRALFIGRNGALLRRDMPPTLARFDPAFFSPDAVSLLFRAQNASWSLYLIGNEDGVARGRVSDATWERFEAGLLEHLKAQGIRIARNYACLDHPQGKGNHKRDSVFLFPNTGALYHAAQEDGIELSESWLIGDNALELAAGWRSGVRIAAVAAQRQARAGEIEVEAALCAPQLAPVLREILAQDVLTRA